MSAQAMNWQVSLSLKAPKPGSGDPGSSSTMMVISGLSPGTRDVTVWGQLIAMLCPV
jgi:hypothetical protein